MGEGRGADRSPQIYPPSLETSSFHGLCELQMDFGLRERSRSSSSSHGSIWVCGFVYLDFFLIICFCTLVFSFLNTLLFIMQRDCCAL